jgi:hypothetical protein
VTRPRLFWAVTHQTLAKSDVPCLEAAGFQVVVEDPEVSVIRDSDILEYPVIGDQSAGWDHFRGLRLWARNGLVFPSEAEAVNAAFDAVMVHTRLDVARNVRSWFEGTVFFRHFGEMPWVEGDPSTQDATTDHAGITYVPLLPSLVGTPLSTTFDDVLLLRSSLPATTEEGGSTAAVVPDRKRIGLFVEKIDDPRKVRDWARKLASDLLDFEIVLMGLEPHARHVLEDLPANVFVPPRLAAAEYWQLFRSLSALIYPYSNPRHIHYVPYEAIALGIPCLTAENAQVGIDLCATLGNGSRQVAGIFPTPQDAIDRAADVVRDDAQLRSIAASQSKVLELMSERAVVDQARSINERVASAPGFRGRGEVVACDIPPSSVVMPRNPICQSAMVLAAHGAVEFDPVAVVTSDSLGRGVCGRFIMHSHDRCDVSLELLPGESHFIRLGMPGAAIECESFLSVTVSVDHSQIFPAELTTLKGADSGWATFVRLDGDNWSSSSNWRAMARVGQRDALRIKVFGDAFDAPLRIHTVRVETMNESQWWIERERHLVEAIERLQVDHRDASLYAEMLEAECALLKQAAEDAGKWGADLEQQVIALRRGSGSRVRARIRKMFD